MTELAFKFETDPQMGVPRLHPMTGTSLAWNARDLQQMEDQLRSRYESLVRDGAGTLQFKGKTLIVKKQEGDTSRQPTLEVHVPVTTTAIAPVPSALPPAPPSSLATPVPQATWFAGWLDEIDGTPPQSLRLAGWIALVCCSHETWIHRLGQYRTPDGGRTPGGGT